jgi:hypothetical protein
MPGVHWLGVPARQKFFSAYSIGKAGVAVTTSASRRGYTQIDQHLHDEPGWSVR